MNARVLLAALLATNIVLGADDAQALLTRLPPAWSMMGNGGPQALPGTCDIGMDNQKSADGSAPYSIRCNSAVLPSFGGARTNFDATPWRGKRVRLSASLMANGIERVANAQYPNAEGEAGLWIGVGTPREGLRSNRMQDRTIKGSTGWETHGFVVDIPADTNQLQAGYWMQGKGQFWVRDLKIEEVPSTVAVTWDRNAPNPDAAPDFALAPLSTPRPGDVFLPPPQKWLALGEQGFEICDAGIDAKMLAAGQRNLSIACTVPVRTFLRQAFPAPTWWGKRVRLSAWIRTEKVEPRPGDNPQVGAAVSSALGAAMYIAGNDRTGPVYNAIVTGTTDWTYYELVVDLPAIANIPQGAQFIPMGLSLNGTGQVWARDFKLEEVSRDTPAARMPALIR